MSERLKNYIMNLESLTSLKGETEEGSIRWYIQWYARRYRSRRILYRSSGTLILLIALFAATQLQGIENLSIPAFLMAATAFIVGLTTFFSWGTAWRGYFLAKVRLEFLMEGWSAALIEAREIGDDNKGIEIVRTSFNELIKQAAEVIAEETKSFFDSIKFPSGDTKIK